MPDLFENLRNKYGSQNNGTDLFSSLRQRAIERGAYTPPTPVNNNYGTDATYNAIVNGQRGNSDNWLWNLIFPDPKQYATK